MKEKFSKNIEADEEIYYMSCPEAVAKHITNKLSKFNSCVELCCGVGVLSIQLAKKLKKVYAVDISNQRIKSAKKNAKLYEVSSKINFINGNVLNINLLKKLKSDVAILDPDWSSKGSEKFEHVASIDETQPSLREMFFLTKKYITNNIVLRIPKAFSFDILKDFGNCEIENVIWNNEIKFKVAYFFENTKDNKEINIYFD